MIFRIAAANDALIAAELVEGDAALGPVSVERPFLVFDFSELTHQESLDSVEEMEAHVGMKIADSDGEEVINALTSLKRAIGGILSDLTRENMIRARALKANSKQSGSQPTLVGESLIEGAPQQSSNAVTDEENDNGTTQPESEQPRRRSGRR